MRVRKIFRKRIIAWFYPFVRKEHLGSRRTNFHEILYFEFFRKSVEKSQVSVMSDKNNEHIYVKMYVHL